MEKMVKEFKEKMYLDRKSFVICHRLANGVLEVKECCVSVNLDFAAEIVDFVRNYAEIEYHLLSCFFCVGHSGAVPPFGQCKDMYL